jgi:magnesium-transporting ATPase (P-type)
VQKKNIEALALSSEKAAEILARDGLNELRKPSLPSLLMLFLSQLTGFIIVLFMFAAVTSIAANATGPSADEWLSFTTGVALMFTVILNAGIVACSVHQAVSRA